MNFGTSLGYVRGKAGEKDSNESTVTERDSEVAGEFVFGWGDVRLDSLKGMPNAEVKYMLRNCVWREVTKIWPKDLEERPKLYVLKELVIKESLKLDVWEWGERRLEECC